MGRKTVVLEEKYSFIENGGYVIKFNYVPKNFLIKLMLKLGLLRIADPVAEVDGGYTHEYISIVKSTKFTKDGIFSTGRGTKIIRVLIEEDVAKIANVTFSIDKLYS